MPFHAVIEKGEIVFRNIRHAAAWKRFKDEHEGAAIILDVDRDDRSTQQLRMYRAWLNQTAAQTGNEPEELHSFLLDKCAPRVVVKIKGAKAEVAVEQMKRTSGAHRLSMTKEEMGDYMDRCASLTGYPLPTPEELEAMGYVSNY